MNKEIEQRRSKMSSKNEPKKPKVTLEDLQKQLNMIEKHLQIECGKCDGTGKPRTKTGEPPKTGGKNIKCSPCQGTGTRGYKMPLMEDNIALIKKDLKRTSDNLKAYINRQFTEIRVLPKGANPSIHGEGGWEDYSGDFYLSDEDQKVVVMEKAKKHFETYFKDGVYHRNKRLGLFLFTPSSGKHLIEEMETD